MKKVLKIVGFYVVAISSIVFVPHYVGALFKYIDGEVINPSTYFNKSAPNWLVGAITLTVSTGLLLFLERIRRCMRDK